MKNEDEELIKKEIDKINLKMKILSHEITSINIMEYLFNKCLTNIMDSILEKERNSQISPPNIKVLESLRISLQNIANISTRILISKGVKNETN